MIKKYSLKKDGKSLVSKNFCVSEFSCKDGSDVVYIDTKLCEILQKIRDRFKVPVTVNSAYRTPSYNLKVGGVSNSQHTKGTAADIALKGVLPKDVAAFAESIMGSSGGIGLYNNFVHIDTREKRARWENYGSEKTVNGFYMADNTTDKTPADAISVLCRKGIINSPDIWYNGRWKDTHIRQLLIKVANYIS